MSKTSAHSDPEAPGTGAPSDPAAPGSGAQEAALRDRLVAMGTMTAGVATVSFKAVQRNLNGDQASISGSETPDNRRADA